MYIQLCDRCGRRTENKPAFLLPEANRKDSAYQVRGAYFGGNTVTLCNNCLEDFENFRTHHLNYNDILDWEKDK